MLPARWRRQRAANQPATSPVPLALKLILLCAFVVSGVLLVRADTCSYTFQCSGSQCAAVMGGWSGTRSSSGVTREQCESARKMAPSIGAIAAAVLMANVPDPVFRRRREPTARVRQA